METYAYSASKAGVHQLTRHLAKFLAPRVTVTPLRLTFESKMMHARSRRLALKSRPRSAEEDWSAV